MKVKLSPRNSTSATLSSTLMPWARGFGRGIADGVLVGDLALALNGAGTKEWPREAWSCR